MATVVVKTIGTGGGRDYSSIATWMAACPADLVTADQVYRGEVYNDSEFVVSAQQSIGSGVTTDATRYIELTAAAGQSFVDHPDARFNPLRYDQSKGVGFTCSLGYTPIFVALAKYTRISRLQIRHTHTGGGGNGCLATSTSTPAGCRYSQLLIVSNANGFGVDISEADTFENSVVVMTRSGGVQGALRMYHHGTLLNCLFVMPSDVATKQPYALWNSYWGTVGPALIIKNCVAVGFTGVINILSGFTATNCYTDVASPPTGFTTVAYDTGSGTGFFSTIGAAPDFRLRRTSALIGAGTNSGAPLTDITGVTRPMNANVDVGPWEVVPSNAAFDQVVFDSGNAQGFYTIGSSQSVSWSHTVGAGSNRALVVMVACANASATMKAATCTYGGVSMGAPVLLPADTSSNITVAIWIMVAPAVGTANIVVDVITPITFLTLDVVSSSWFYVDQASPNLEPYRLNKSFAASPFVLASLPFMPGGVVVDMLSDRTVGQTVTPDASQTRIGSQINGAGSTTSSGSYKAAAGGMSWTFSNSGSAVIGYGAVCLKPSFTLGTIHRPNGDVGQPQWMATPANWRRWEALDESAANDADYVFADVGSAPYVAEVGPLAAGTYTTRVRASVASGTGTLTIRLLDASMAVLATSAPQAVTTTPTTFAPALTIASGTAYFVSAEITA